MIAELPTIETAKELGLLPEEYDKIVETVDKIVNLINKSENKIYQARADFFDKDGDPVNALRLQFLDIPPNTGKEIDFGPGCKEELKYKITVW